MRTRAMRSPPIVRMLSGGQGSKRRLKRYLLSKLLLVMVWVGGLAMLSYINSHFGIDIFSQVHRRSLEGGEDQLYYEPPSNYNRTETTCNSAVRMPAGIPRDTFQHVQGSDIYVYSAYLDRRVPGKHKVRIIGLSPVQPGPVFCEYYYEDGTVVSTPATNVLTSVDLTLHRNFRFKPYLFYCNETRGKKVDVVSLTRAPCAVPSNMLLVTPIMGKSELEVEDSLAICLRTLHHVHSPYVVIEFVELQRFLGVQHFYVYGAEDVSQPVQRILDYYASLGLLTILPWHLPVKNSPVFEKPGEIAIHAQHALNNDCLYRTMNIHRLVFMHDMDEYIIPRNPNIRTVRELLNQIHEAKKSQGNTEKYASYFFLNCYFCLEQSDYSNSGPQLLTLKRNYRHVCLKPEMERAWRENPSQRHIEGGRGAAKKSLIYPMRVIQMGVHGIIDAIPGYQRELKVGTYYAAMHHYKRPADIACQTPDNTLVYKYQVALKDRVNKVCADIGIPQVK